jgi:hypothetical protein
MSSGLPAAYRWFLLNGLTDWSRGAWKVTPSRRRRLPISSETNTSRINARSRRALISISTSLHAVRIEKIWPSSSAGPMVRSKIQRSQYISRSAGGSKGAMTRPEGNEVTSFIQWIRTVATEDMQDWIEDFDAHPDLY